MNTGIGDAVDLAWKLSANLQGWGGEILLDSYGLERKPVAERITRFSTGNLQTMKKVPNAGRRNGFALIFTVPNSTKRQYHASWERFPFLPWLRYCLPWRTVTKKVCFWGPDSSPICFMMMGVSSFSVQ